MGTRTPTGADISSMQLKSSGKDPVFKMLNSGEIDEMWRCECRSMPVFHDIAEAPYACHQNDSECDVYSTQTKKTLNE